MDPLYILSDYLVNGKESDYSTVTGRFKKENTYNVFCPTGPGGGVDPTCSHTGVSATVRQAWADRLPAAQRDAVRSWSYSAAGCSEIRAAQTGGRASRKVAQRVKDFEAACASAPKFVGTVYRVVNWAGEHHVGDMVTFAAHSSATKDTEIAASFAEGDSSMLYELKQRSGADISKASTAHSRNQREVVVPKNTRFRVTAVSDGLVGAYPYGFDRDRSDDESVSHFAERVGAKPSVEVRVRRVTMEEV